MILKKCIALILVILSVLLVFIGCSGHPNDKSKNQSSTGNDSKEPTLVSANESKTWSGADLVITFSYEKQIEKSQIKVMIGGLPAEIKYCSNNQVSITAPFSLTAGKQNITATLDGKDCKGTLSIEVAAPIIKVINTFSTGPSIEIEIENIKKNSDSIKVYLNNTELPYSYLTDLGAAGKYSIVVDLPKEVKGGEIYVVYGVNKSNTMTFSIE